MHEYSDKNLKRNGSVGCIWAGESENHREREGGGRSDDTSENKRWPRMRFNFELAK